MAGLLVGETVRRYWVDAKMITANGQVLLTGETLHHIVDVCRMRVGDRFEVLNEQGQIYFVELKSLSKKSAECSILETRISPPRPKPELVLALSLPRFTTFDAVLEKSVEL